MRSKPEHPGFRGLSGLGRFSSGGRKAGVPRSVRFPEQTRNVLQTSESQAPVTLEQTIATQTLDRPLQDNAFAMHPTYIGDAAQLGMPKTWQTPATNVRSRDHLSPRQCHEPIAMATELQALFGSAAGSSSRSAARFPSSMDSRACLRQELRQAGTICR